MGLEDLQKTIKKSGSPLNIVLLILNIIWPGIGTMINSCLGGFDSKAFLIGLAQWLLCCCFIGWIWSIYWGVLIFQKG